MKLAILGTRGVPAKYGGFETFAEELGARLAERGHEVWVYGRPRFVDPELERYRGMHLRVVKTIHTKHLETVVHTFNSCLDARSEGFDAALVCNAANAIWIRLLQRAGIPVALNVDGLERHRRKWGMAGRLWYRIGEALSARWPDVTITDAEVIRRYYALAYRRESEMIVYGGDLPRPKGHETLDELGLEAGGYVFYVSRFEPENNPDRVAAAWREVDSDLKLALIGGAPYADALTRRVAELADERTVLPGPIYGEGYRQLLFNARAYVHATEVGGTHPALVEAMGAGLPVLYLDTPENREVVGEAGLAYRFDTSPTLAERLRQLLGDAELRDKLGIAAAERVAEHYCWDAVADRYETILGGLAEKGC